MTSRNLTKRLERLETRLAQSEQRVLRIVVTRVGSDVEKIIEIHPHPPGRRPEWKGQETGRL
jgi:hypothetical protein